VYPNRPPDPLGAPGTENALVGRLTAVLDAASGGPPPGQIWIGDDAAVLGRPAGRLVLATDAVVEGVHVDLDLVAPSDAGWKSMAAALSDVGAVGARPSHALVTLAVPPGIAVAGVIEGVAEASAEWQCPVVGGDLTASSVLVISVAVAGVLEGERPPVSRAGARPGDWLALTGPLGSSSAGLRALRDGAAGSPATAAGMAVASAIRSHRRPRARLAEGLAAREAGASAMIDVSDGLAIDLHRLADASGVGFELDRVPVVEGATTLDALGGGEDYELVIATPAPESLSQAFNAAGLRSPVVIGRCVEDPARRVLRGEMLEAMGWEHRIG
jgi:thiamine-monophosphate kinase